MKRTLWISRRVPYDVVPHAGGKIHNFLLKEFKKAGLSEFHLISFAKEDEVGLIDLEHYGISYDISVISSRKTFSFFVKKFFSFLFFLTIPLGFDSFWYVCKTFKYSLMYRFKHGSPDVIFLQWTEMVNQILWLKFVFPKAKFVSIEEDVSFLRKQRNLKQSAFPLKCVKFPFYILFKKIELASLNCSDIVVLNNEKDKLLVLDFIENKDHLFVCHPYFKNMMNLQNKSSGKDILFYGAMARPDNYLSAIWFIKNVFPRISDRGFRFVVLGNKPHESLMKYHNGKNIDVVGFVDDVAPYFENSLCLVAPLVIGAGIKIKILESMSCGLPVLTNEIGIEGIFANDCEEYFYCQTPDDYVRRILELDANPTIGEKMGKKSKDFIEKKFNYKQDAIMLFNLIYRDEKI